MPRSTPAGIHGSEDVQDGRLVGATDTDYFYFLCPKCDDSPMLRLLDYYVLAEGPVRYAPDTRNDAKRDFNLAFELKCEECGFTDYVKISNTGYQGGKLADRIDRRGRSLTWS